MLRIELRHDLGDADRARVYALVADVQLRTGHRPLSDRSWLDLVHGGRSWHAAILCSDGPTLLASCHISGEAGAWAVEMVIDRTRVPDTSVRDVAAPTLHAALAEIAHAGGGGVHWWVFDDDLGGADVALAADVGLEPGRTLFQMRVPLPLQGPDGAVSTDVATRPFEVGRDEAAWLEVNNTAFAAHAEQGAWDLATLELREREDWFDPDGFLVHERDGRMVAFCWTKLHHDTEPVLGEIYVVAAHPDVHGLGLGRALTIAGLASIASRGVHTGMLFVDCDNVAAVGLYRSLGFTVHRTDRAYVGQIAPAAASSETADADLVPPPITIPITKEHP